MHHEEKKYNTDVSQIGQALVTDGGLERHPDRVREYTADGTLYAERSDDETEHIVVSNGREPQDQWEKRVPARRTAVIPGEQLWTIPDNWEKIVRLQGAGTVRYEIYHIPETGVDVKISHSSKNTVGNAWFDVENVGELNPQYTGEVRKENITEALTSAELMREEIDDDVFELLKEIQENQNQFERLYVEAIDTYADDTVENLIYGGNLNGKTIECQEVFRIDNLLSENFDVEPEAAKEVQSLLWENNVVDRYPEIKLKMEDGKGLPQGFKLQALVEAGASPSEALDYLMTEMIDESEFEWEEIRQCDESVIEENVDKVSEKLSC